MHAQVISLDAQRARRMARTGQRSDSLQLDRLRESCGVDVSCKSYFVNFSQVLAAGAQAAIIARPQETFSPHTMAIAGPLGMLFTVDDVAVGKDSQNVEPGTGMLAQVWNEQSQCGRIRFDTVCYAGKQVVVTVTNISAGQQTFFATMFGDSVEDDCK